ncbi:UDPGP type 1 family protein [Paenibacillus filicis]|uniref:UDPGP type 1 family protein n=1 Tax=Paenibacillus gyeongsangnamensis TaxID=3388067 RepID=A0ABT4QKZ2_9BACL|nr:UDPGP type 1 family protein [Paenibacillus filicis]MCZ8517390.1 UDPGP type 1 family protein [Paenibacillus filicis]
MENLERLDPKLLGQLRHFRQEHVLRFYDVLPKDSRERLLEQLKKLDFTAIDELYRTARRKAAVPRRISPLAAIDWDAYSKEEQAQFAETGWELLRQGKIGALVVAGGQGSRLGHDGPKGTYDIGLPSGKSLFQLQAERLLRLSRLSGRSLPWYIMTSPDNHRETERFFKNYGYFGYPEDEVILFQQADLPALDMEGRLLLAEKDELRLAPSGNGEVFTSMKRTGALDDLKRRGIRWLFYYNVDNALIKIADPLFLGVVASFGHPIATKAVDKASPDEKVGTLCLQDGRPAVVEYTDIPEELKYERDATGRLAYGLGSISIHLFRTDFIERYADTPIPYHAAHKKISFFDDQGSLHAPAQPNAYKFERFIFDYFPLAEAMTVLKMRREDEFAPVKNKEGEDSPATARRLVLEQHRRWLLQAGVPSRELEGREAEISPLLSYAGEGLTPEALGQMGLSP